MSWQMDRPHTLAAYFEDALDKVAAARKMDKEAIRAYLAEDRQRFECIWFTARGPKQRAAINGEVEFWLEPSERDYKTAATKPLVPVQLVGNLHIEPTAEELSSELMRANSED